MSDQSCANCNAALPEGARFCMSCGQPVAAAGPVDEEARARLTAAAPTPLREKMRAARLTGERKPVTALFADVVGSTSLAESMDPEDWTSIMNGAFEAMSGAIHRYEGTIAKLVGDAVLAFFGAPVAHEDDPERAVRAALDMLDAVGEYAAALKADYGIGFAVRIGINTGQVMVGNVGSDLRYEYTALGDAVNVAARMQTAARPGSVLITDATYRFVAHAVNATDLGDLDVKGRSDPVRAYEVTGLRTIRGSSRGLAGLESPMIGRDDMLATLRRLLDATRAGSGRAAFVLAEAGLGKSRLLRELHTAVAGEVATWAEGHALSYGQTLPDHLLVDLVRSLVGATAAAEEAEVRAALDARIADVLTAAPDEDLAETHMLLGHLLSVDLPPDERARANGLEPQTLAAGYLKALRRFLVALAARGPVVLVLEDIHWADSASVGALVGLLPLLVDQPIMLLAAGRPDRDAIGYRLLTAAHARLGGAVTEIPLYPLNETESRVLVSNLLEIESLPPAVRGFILARAEGNPFFVEEVIRMLIDRGAIERSGDQWRATRAIEGVEIPDTLQGLLLARIDRLPEEAKRTLRVASVIGRQFSVRVLADVLERSAPS